MTLPLAAFATNPPPVTWRYYFTDLRSGNLLGILPLLDVSLSDILGGAASAKATVPLNAPGASGFFSATIPRRTCLWAERQVLDRVSRQVVRADTMWGGIIMGRSRKRGDRSMALSAVTWPSYFGNRLVGDHTYTQADKFQIMRELVAASAAQPPSGTLPAVPVPLTPLTAVTGPLSGTAADRTYLASDLKPTLTELTALGTSGSGFDWRMTPYRDPAVANVGQSFRVRLDLGAPRLGRVSPADLRWSAQRADQRSRWGWVSDYTITEDGAPVYNRVVALGSGTGPTQLRADVDAAAVGLDEIGYGYPRYETSLMSSTADLRTQDAVDAHAVGSLQQQLAGAFVISGIKVRGDLAPQVYSYQVGDDVTLKLDETTTGSPQTYVGQLVGRTIEPQQQGRVETVTMDIRGSLAA